jgi:hypothetical protein
LVTEPSMSATEGRKEEEEEEGGGGEGGRGN